MDKIRPFDHKGQGEIFLQTLRYYRSIKAIIRFSEFNSIQGPLKVQKEIELTYVLYFKVNIIAFCLMPNHFHLLIQQKISGGIIKFMSDISNSFTRYFNLKLNRNGPLFLPQFKSRRILTDEQLMHVSRYIHLNPYSSGLIKNKNSLLTYPLSSFNEYVSLIENGLCDPELVLQLFNNDREKYLKFVLNHAEYQKELHDDKHSTV